MAKKESLLPAVNQPYHVGLMVCDEYGEPIAYGRVGTAKEMGEELKRVVCDHHNWRYGRDWA